MYFAARHASSHHCANSAMLGVDNVIKEPALFLKIRHRQVTKKLIHCDKLQISRDS
jgi:hypothetical protein